MSHGLDVTTTPAPAPRASSIGRPASNRNDSARRIRTWLAFVSGHFPRQRYWVKAAVFGQVAWPPFENVGLHLLLSKYPPDVVKCARA
jgi:hypothetical protein